MSDRMYVSNEIRGIHSIKEDQHQTIYLSYEPKNEHAKPVYEKLGFREVESLNIGDEQVSRFTFYKEQADEGNIAMSACSCNFLASSIGSS